jgi:hypothetical protein
MAGLAARASADPLRRDLTACHCVCGHEVGWLILYCSGTAVTPALKTGSSRLLSVLRCARVRGIRVRQNLASTCPPHCQQRKSRSPQSATTTSWSAPGPSGWSRIETASASGQLTDPTSARYRGTRTRHQGHIQVGGITKHVTFLDAVNGQVAVLMATDRRRPRPQRRARLGIPRQVPALQRRHSRPDHQPRSAIHHHRNDSTLNKGLSRERAIKQPRPGVPSVAAVAMTHASTPGP